MFSGRKQLKIPTIVGFNPSQLSEGRKTELKARKRKGKKCSSASSSNSTHVPTTSSSLTVPKLVPKIVTLPVMNPPRLVCPKPNASVATILTIHSGRNPEGILPKLMILLILIFLVVFLAEKARTVILNYVLLFVMQLYSTQYEPDEDEVYDDPVAKVF